MAMISREEISLTNIFASGPHGSYVWTANGIDMLSWESQVYNMCRLYAPTVPAGVTALKIDPLRWEEANVSI